MKKLSLHTIITILISHFLVYSCDDEPYFQEPIIDFTICLTDSIAPVNVNFQNTSVNLSNFEWDFGDGYTSLSESPEHTYNDAGEYCVTLRALFQEEEHIIQKTVVVSKVYRYSITNNSPFVLYNLTSFTIDNMQVPCKHLHGILNESETCDASETVNDNIYISFENEEGLRFKTAFPFRLREDILNQLFIDNHSLVIIDN